MTAIRAGWGRRRGLAVLGLCALAGALVPPPGALAADASRAEVRALATAAARDPAALERLRAIDSIGGRPVRLGPALKGTRAEVRERLRVLAESPPEGFAAPAGAGARRAAGEVLADRRFHPSTLPTPFRDLIAKVGEVIAKPFVAAYEWLARKLPGGAATLWVIIAAVIVAGAAWLAARAGARRDAAAAQRGTDARKAERLSAGRLRHDADAAERDGDLERALRLRFRAGLVELDDRDLIELRPALTNRELLARVRSPTLTGLVSGFESVAYGGRPAVAEDLRSARDGWPAVVDEASAP